MQTNGWLIQHVEGLTCAALGEFTTELDALCFTTGECRRGLSDPNVAQTNRIERLRYLDVLLSGAPTYVIGGEMFWGQDRLDFVARKLGVG